jgi:hypothetical protein
MKIKGRELNPPLMILRRATCFPFLLAGLCIAYVAALLGWGLYDANKLWKDAW